MLIYSSGMGRKVSRGFVTLFSICSLAYIDCQWRWSCNNWIWILRRFTYKVTVEVKVGSKINVVECLGGPKPRKKDAAEHAAEGALWYLRGLGHKIWRISNCPINYRYPVCFSSLVNKVGFPCESSGWPRINMFFNSKVCVWFLWPRKQLVNWA